MHLSELDKNIINRWQGDFPLSTRPYLAMAKDLEVDETTLLNRLEYLIDCGVLSRFGPLYNIEKLGGKFCLAAMSVPEDRFDEVMQQVNSFYEVAHNYQREHKFNMWFVIATSLPEEINQVSSEIERMTGLKVCLFPKQQEFFVELKLTV